MNEDGDINYSACLDVVVALVFFFEANQDSAVPIKLLKALLEHYNIINTT